MSFKTSLLSVAVLLTLSSCGKNKELKTSPDAKAPPATTQTQDDTKKSPPADTGDQAKPDDTKSDVKPVDKAPVKNDDRSADGGKKQSGRDTGRGQSAAEPKVPKAAPAPKAKDRTSDEPKVVPVKRVEVMRVQKQINDVDVTQPSEKTGGSENELLYTGAGSDGLLNEFKAKSAAVSSEQQRRNSNLAKAIVGARLTKSIGQDSIVDLAIDERIQGVGSIKNYRFKAQPAGNMLKLSSIAQSGNGNLEFQGGFLKCLDLNGQCATAYAKIKMSGAYTRVIFRKSVADTYFLTQQFVEDNLAFDVLKSYAENAQNGIQTSRKIDNVVVSSYEVTNGRASMGVAITTADKELIGLSVPLLVSNSGSAVDTGVAKVSDISKSYDLVSSAGYSSRISDSITDARLVANNGKGQLKVKLNFASGLNSGSIWLVMSTVEKKTMSVEQVRAFEATVKAF
ncbi:MAG: hypothetical protein H7256_13290 [Bdellovibrio sp.]|nr:hypothetical protein [Bdellovibrio sp.]